MNKTQLIDALAERLGDKKIAAAAVEGLVDLVVRTVNGGDRVTITGARKAIRKSVTKK
ncbi:MAG TPA: HU family DNA-binding protein [Pseudonocardiaceae bacterium]|nr:HU family DNA-binding protein [Pseudonocardiaceae bacterium]